MEQHVFSTGKVLVGPVGADALTEENHLVGIIQGATLEIKYNKKELQAPPSQSMFPVDVAFFGGQAALKIDSNALTRELLERVAGAAKSVDGTNDVYTIGKTSKPNYCRVEFHTEDTEGRPIVVTLYKGVAPGMPLRFKLDDFVDTALEFEGYPSSANADKVCDIVLAQ